MEPNSHQMLVHLELLFGRVPKEYPGGRVEIRCLCPLKERNPQALTFDASNLSEAQEYAVKMNADRWNVYLGVNPRKPNTPPFGACSADDVEIAFFNFGDLDTELAVTAYETLNKSEPKFFVITGKTPSTRGHPYYELEDPCKNLGAWQNIQRGIADTFGGDRVIDAPRIMRLAGTVSYPGAHKQGKGYIEEAVTLIEKDSAPISSHDLAAQFPIKPRDKVPANYNLPTFGGLDIKNCLNDIRARKELHNNTRDIIAHMVSVGVPSHTIKAIMESQLEPVSNGGTIQQIPQLISSAVLKYSPANEESSSERNVCNPIELEGQKAPPRDWLVDGLIPAKNVTLLTGNGGLGKSLLAQQLCTATALGHDWLGIKTKQCPSFALFCEDDQDELHRRQIDICNSTMTPFSHLENMRWMSGIGGDNVLMNFDQRSSDKTLTPFFFELMELFKELKPGLIVIDTLADTFGGNEIMSAQVRAFINNCLSRYCREIGAAVVLLGHPSRAGLSTGDGLSGNMQWNNAVRSRLYLTKPDDSKDENERVLSTMKANYGPSGSSIDVRWNDGLFVPINPLTGVVGQIDSRNNEKVFLNCLKAIEERGSKVSESRNSANYAPKVIALMPESGRAKKRDLEKAMLSLFSAGDIINEQYGPPSKLRSRVIRKPVEVTEND
jgi:RecA-family ATPase